MRVTEPTARKYLDDETVKDIARRMLFEFAGEQPGADLLEAPRTVPLPLVRVGVIVAAPAEAMQIRAANEPADRLGDVVATYGQALSGFGQITADAASRQAGDPAEVMFPPAFLRSLRQLPPCASSTGCARREDSWRARRPDAIAAVWRGPAGAGLMGMDEQASGAQGSNGQLVSASYSPPRDPAGSG